MAPKPSAHAMLTGISVVKTAPAVWLVVKHIAHLSLRKRKSSLRVRNLSVVAVLAALALKEKKYSLSYSKPTKNLTFKENQ